MAFLKLHFQSKENFIRTPSEAQTKEPSSVAEQREEESINLINFDRATQFCEPQMISDKLQISIKSRSDDTQLPFN